MGHTEVVTDKVVYVNTKTQPSTASNMIPLGGGVLTCRSCQPEKFLSGWSLKHKKGLTQSLLITKSTGKKKMAPAVASRSPEESAGSRDLPKPGTNMSVHRLVDPWQCVQPQRRSQSEQTLAVGTVWRLSGCQSSFFNTKVS